MAFSKQNRRGPYNKYLETENPLENLPRRTRYRQSSVFVRKQVNNLNTTPTICIHVRKNFN